MLLTLLLKELLKEWNLGFFVNYSVHVVNQVIHQMPKAEECT